MDVNPRVVSYHPEMPRAGSCLGDARGWERWVELVEQCPDLYLAGMPCTDYASLGKRQGSAGKKNGDLFIIQIDTIKSLNPKIVILEMVPTALETNEGYEVKLLIENLSTHYHVNADILSCWKYGDPTARERLIFSCLRRDCFPENICRDRDKCRDSRRGRRRER